MQKANLEYVIASAAAGRSKIANAVRASTEVGVVVPSILRNELTAEGFTVLEDEASVADYGFASTKVLQRVLVLDGKANIVAMGAAGDHAEALLHAMLGYFRENPVAGVSVTPEAGFGEAPANPLT